MFQCILPSQQKDGLWTPRYPNAEKDFPSERFCFLVATMSSDQFCLCQEELKQSTEELVFVAGALVMLILPLKVSAHFGV
jgi:hypothetical protein